MKKIMDLGVARAETTHPQYTLLTLCAPLCDDKLPEMKPGQFVQVAVPDAPHTFLRRPISINSVNPEAEELTLLIRRAGEGTSRLCDLNAGDIVNLILPLGNGFSIPASQDGRLILAGGGVGIAPMCYLGSELKARGMKPEFIVGARSKEDLLEIDTLREMGEVYITTDDGTAGEHGLITGHSTWNQGDISMVYCCGPAPMMKAVARLARDKGAECEVSLENMMACGLGACLCCVEKTVKGNVCVCTEGPVFNTRTLTWLD
ncbi:MAG: dihydroorotate dehydrogenase electron transfer subunit [Pseudoflavonifractor sp.]|nr:dihydroorotate dehydrogenase electron transfer subunit [Alloprevotella sp.]MCM1116380.1 dihydroorotate dehydrogenase electron transfer subunit [Pseudoflavonifractor sp.]